MAWKQKPPEDAEPLSVWMWLSGGLLCAAMLVALFSGLTRFF